MNVPNLFDLLRALEDQHVDGWHGTHVRRGRETVELDDRGLTVTVKSLVPTFHYEFRFTEAGQTHTLVARRPLLGDDPDRLTLDNQALPGEIALRLHLQGTRPRVEVRCRMPDDATEYYRFDGDLQL